MPGARSGRPSWALQPPTRPSPETSAASRRASTSSSSVTHASARVKPAAAATSTVAAPGEEGQSSRVGGGVLQPPGRLHAAEQPPAPACTTATSTATSWCWHCHQHCCSSSPARQAGPALRSRQPQRHAAPGGRPSARSCGAALGSSSRTGRAPGAGVPVRREQRVGRGGAPDGPLLGGGRLPLRGRGGVDDRERLRRARDGLVRPARRPREGGEAETPSPGSRSWRRLLSGQGFRGDAVAKSPAPSLELT